MEFLVNPLPLTFTTDPPERPVSGLTTRTGLFAADAASIVSTPGRRTAAPAVSAITTATLVRRSGPRPTTRGPVIVPPPIACPFVLFTGDPRLAPGGRRAGGADTRVRIRRAKW